MSPLPIKFVDRVKNKRGAQDKGHTTKLTWNNLKNALIISFTVLRGKSTRIFLTTKNANKITMTISENAVDEASLLEKSINKRNL